MDEANDRWLIGQVVDGTDQECGLAARTISQRRLYRVEVEVSSGAITLRADGAVKVSATCSSEMSGGKMGLRAADAHTHFKEAALEDPVNVTRYYSSDGRRAAMRKDGVLYLVASDHLRFRGDRLSAPPG